MKYLSCAASLAILLLAGSCSKYNPFDSYWHEGFEREDIGGKPGAGGLFADGYGTEESPYGLSTAQHMKNMSRILVDEETIYFRMLNDIDLSNVSWGALNPTDPYKKFINFDGNGHVILNLTTASQAYGSFFGVLCGDCHDVGFLNANVQSSKAGGVIGGYVGLASPSDDSFTGRVERVYVTGSVTASSSAGGICGVLGKMVDMSPCVIRDCYSLAEVSGSNAGGLAGEVRAGSRIENSYATGSVITAKKDGSTYYGGGIAGNVTGVVSNCIAWNASVKGDKVGTVYGNKATDGSIENCCSLSGMTLSGTEVAQENVTVKDEAGLQDVATAWGSESESGWFPDGAVSNGFPICKWQHERGDYALYSGHGGPTPTYDPAFKGGSGTQADPYIIEDMFHLLSMHDLLESGHEYWLRLDADVNLTVLSQWVPVNAVDPFGIKIHFDGNGHKISNLKSNNCKYASFFGVLNGECKDLTLENCSVTTNTSPSGLLGGYAGNSSGSFSATVSNITVIDGAVSNSSNSPCGMLFGQAVNATFSHCTVESGTVESQNASSSTGDHGCGGLAGQARGTTSFSHCTNKASVSGSRLIGGICGYARGTTISFTKCSNTGSVSATSIGSARGLRAGGIVGHTDNAAISACCSSGNITAENVAGGICGFVQKGDISNCWSSGLITVTKFAGGIAGEIRSGYLSDSEPNAAASVVNCYSKCAISSSGDCLGGIIGRCANEGDYADPAGSSANRVSNLTVNGCIAWNASLSAPGTADDGISSGAVIGYSYIKNTLGNCWRNPSMVLQSNAANTLSDQENVSASSPLPAPSAGHQKFSPYHGRKAAAGSTIKSLAQSLGWDTGIWNLSGSEPSLK